MYQIFSRNTPLSYALMPIVQILFRLRLFTQPERYVLSDEPDLYTPMWKLIFGHLVAGTIPAAILTLGLLLLCALAVGLVANRFNFTNSSSLPVFFFIVLSGAFIPSMTLHPILPFTFFFTIAVGRLFMSKLRTKPMTCCYFAFFLFLVGCLFWAKGIWLLPLMFVSLFVLRVATGRTLVASLLGLASPVIIGATALIWLGDIPSTLEAYNRSVFVTLAAWHLGWKSWVYVATILIFTLAAVISAQKRMPTMKITESLCARVIVWVVFYVIFLIIMPGFYFETQPLLASAVAILMAPFVSSLQNIRIRETLTTILVLVTLWYQWR